MKEVERQLKALANKRRLHIISFLKRNRRGTVEDIAGAIKLSFKATSKHLAILSSRDMLDKEQISRYVYYHLANPLPPLARYVRDLL